MFRPFVAVALLTATAPALAQSPAETAEKARAVLEANCFRCHGKDDSGHGKHNSALSKEAQRRVLV